MTSKRRVKRLAPPVEVGAAGVRQLEVLAPEELTRTQGLLWDCSLGLYGRDDKGQYRVSDRISVIANVSDSAGGSYGLLVAWEDNRGRTKRMVLPMDGFYGDPKNICSRLVAAGLDIEIGCQQELIAYLYYCGKHAKHMQLVKQIGWHDGHYVLPDRSFGKAEAEPVMLDPTIQTSKFRTAGSLEEWIDAVGKRCRGNSRLLLGVSCVFAGPLLKLTGESSTIMHLRGPSTGGKTTTLKAAASVSGGGEDKMLRTWRSTGNGIEATLAVHNDSTLCLDELHQADAKTVVDTVYMIGNGTGKQRTNINLTSPTPPNWTALVLSSGEIDLAAHAASSGVKVKGGAEMRMLNVEADAGAGMGVFEELHGVQSPEQFARELSQNTDRFYGTPFRAFLETLTNFDQEFLQEFISDLTAEFFHSCRFREAAPEVQRAANKFALLAVAGELATIFDVTGWMSGEALEGVLKCFESWRARRGGDTVVHDEQAGVSQIKYFIERFGPSRFEVIGATADGGNREATKAIPDRAGFKRRQPDGTTEYLFLRSVFKEEVCKGHDYQLVCKALSRDGHLRTQPPAYTIHTTTPEGKMHLFCVIATLLNEPEP